MRNFIHRDSNNGNFADERGFIEESSVPRESTIEECSKEHQVHETNPTELDHSGTCRHSITHISHIESRANLKLHHVKDINAKSTENLQLTPCEYDIVDSGSAIPSNLNLNS